MMLPPTLALVASATRLAAEPCPRSKPIRTVYLEIADLPAPGPQLSVLVTEPGRQTITRPATPKEGGRWAVQLTQPVPVAAVKVEPARRPGFVAVPQGSPWLELDERQCVAVFSFVWEEVWNVTVESQPSQLLATSELARSAKGVERSDLRTSFTIKDIPADGALTLRLHAAGGGGSWPIILRRRDFTGPSLTTADVRRRLCVDVQNSPTACISRMMQIGARNLTLSVNQRQ